LIRHRVLVSAIFVLLVWGKLGWVMIEQERQLVRILIGDDHSVVRRGLKQILADCSFAVEYVEACNGLEVLECVRKGKFDLVILDLNMPTRHGLDVLKDLRYEFPDLPVLVLTMHEESQYALRVIKSGAAGYMTKDCVPTDLVHAVEKVIKGERYITPSLADKLASSIRRELGSVPHEQLSDREYQVLCLIAGGKLLKEIAEELSLSVKTVSTYRTRILQKMQMKSNSEITRYAISNQLIV